VITQPAAPRDDRLMDTLRNWIAAFAAAAWLGAAIVFAGALASADAGTTTVGPTVEAPAG